MEELQEELLKNDLYLIGLKNEDPEDKARNAIVVATSEKEGYQVYNVISGVTRIEGDNSNLWSSHGIRIEGEQLTLQLANQTGISQIRLVFDPDLNGERCITVSNAFIEKQPKGVAKTLVKDYTVEAICDKQISALKSICNNYQGLNIINLESQVIADTIRITIHSTNGSPDAHIYEVRVY